MKKSKTITLLKDIEDSNWWQVELIISDVGKIADREKFHYRNDKSIEYNKKYHQNHRESDNKYSKEYYESHPMVWKQWKSYKQHIKTFTLLSGVIEGISWSVQTQIK